MKETTRSSSYPFVLLLLFFFSLPFVVVQSKESISCSLCQQAVGAIDVLITVNTTEAELKVILNDLCKVLAGFGIPEAVCRGYVDQYGNAVGFIFEEEIDADRICAMFHFCSVNTTTPNFLHLAFTNDPTEMSVSWLTYVPTATSTCQWGPSQGQFVGQAQGKAYSYLESAGWTHKVVLTGLKPSTRYYYQCGDAAGGWSRIFSFSSAPSVSKDFAIAIYGDMGVHNSEGTALMIDELVVSGKIDWVYHIGDISYADDYPANIYEYVWDEWFKKNGGVLSSMGYMVCPGNHEYSCDHEACMNYSVNFTAYNYRFRMPGQESGSNTNMWYSFDYSWAHFVSISTETDYPNCPYPSQFGNQLQWLENDLKKANASRSAQRPWIIVVGHRPVYTSNQQTNGQPNGYALHLQAAVEELFYKYHVDIYFAGHVHSYERTYPTYQGKVMTTSYVNPNATTYVISGAAGCLEGLTPWANVPTAPWSVIRDNTEEGFGILKVTQQALGWNYYTSSYGNLVDSFVLQKD